MKNMAETLAKKDLFWIHEKAKKIGLKIGYSDYEGLVERIAIKLDNCSDCFSAKSVQKAREEAFNEFIICRNLYNTLLK